MIPEPESVPSGDLFISGFNARPPSPHRLRAGAFQLWFDGGALRYIGTDSGEAVRGIYVAIRDRNWATIPGQIHGLKISEDHESFGIEYISEHKQGGIDFVWHGTIVGQPTGNIRFTMEGEARGAFLRNRIGFCILHPIEPCAGQPCWIRRANGGIEVVTFSDKVATAQPVEGFSDIKSMAYQIGHEEWIELAFEGDIFETEDQRNWIDASFKTYCTPLHLSLPVPVQAGTKLRQAVTAQITRGQSEFQVRWPKTEVSKVTLPSAHRPTYGFARSMAVKVRLDPAARSFPLPEIGLQLTEPSADLPDSALKLQARSLALLRLAHLRADVRLANPNWQLTLQSAVRQSAFFGTPLELAVYLPSQAAESRLPLAQLASCLNEPSRRRAGFSVKRILAIQEPMNSTSETALNLARSHLGSLNAPLGAGTDLDLYQLHLQRPPDRHADFIFWSMNPQVHTFDNQSIAETPGIVSHQVRTAMENFPGKDICISPVTMGRRTVFDEQRCQRGAEVDPRHVSLFGAGWFLAMFKNLSEANVACVTFCETTGLKGVIPSGEERRGARSSPPASAFPVFHVFADLAGFHRGLKAASEMPSVIEALALSQSAGKKRLIVANLTGEEQRVALDLPVDTFHISVMDQASVQEAMEHPAKWREKRGVAHRSANPVNLGPYAVARLDF